MNNWAFKISQAQHAIFTPKDSPTPRALYNWLCQIFILYRLLHGPRATNVGRKIWWACAYTSANTERSIDRDDFFWLLLLLIALPIFRFPRFLPLRPYNRLILLPDMYWIEWAWLLRARHIIDWKHFNYRHDMLIKTPRRYFYTSHATEFL